MDNRGSVLVLTLAFIFVFTLMGLSSIYQAGQFNAAAEKQQRSMEAFWLADGGVERAVMKLRKTPVELISSSEVARNLGRGHYDVYSQADPYCTLCIDRWMVRSIGVVMGEVRNIEAIAAKYDIDKVLITRGGVKDFDKCPMASITIDCSMVEEYRPFTFESILNGTSQADIVAAATHIYIDPSNSGDVDPIEGVTVIYLTGNNTSLSITTDNQIGSTFLLIDLTAVTSGNTPQINIAGNPDFQGIIWIVGEAELKGTAGIRGAVFVQGDSTLDTKVAGNVSLTFGPADIAAAIGHVGSPGTGIPAIISWKEI